MGNCSEHGLGLVYRSLCWEGKEGGGMPKMCFFLQLYNMYRPTAIHPDTTIHMKT